MPRTQGSKNVAPFDQRKRIDTTDSAKILHMADYESSPIEHFRSTIKNQNNFMGWMKNQNDQLKKMKAGENARLGLNGRRALSVKGKPYNKYSLYIQQVFLLEIINSYEVFYKRSIIRLAEIMKPYITPDSLKGEVEAKVLWYANSSTSMMSLIFEKRLYHDLASVDDATNMLVGRKRYNPNNKKGPIYDSIVVKLRAVFQIRHTLSHNSGYVTGSDAAKLRNLGYEIEDGEVLDPFGNGLLLSVSRFLRNEAEEFTDWLRDSAKDYLKETNQSVSIEDRELLKRNFGGDDQFWSIAIS